MSDPLSLVANVAGLTSLANELLKILKAYASDAKSAPTDVSQLLIEVEALNTVLRQLLSFLLDNDIDQDSFKETSVLLSIIAICKTKLENLYQKLKKKYPGKKGVPGLIDRLQWPFDKQECVDTITTLHRCTQIFKFSLNISNWYVQLYDPIKSKYTLRSIFENI